MTSASAVANAPMSLSILLLLWCTSLVIPVAAIHTGETTTDPTKYPFYAMLGNPHVCGGIFLSLNPPIILTAAHCVADAPHPSTLSKKNPYFVGYSHVDRRKQKTQAIVDWVIHPDYYDKSSHGAIDMHHDIALIKLAQPITDEPFDRVSRVALWPSDGNLKSTQGVLMGFGYTDVGEPEAHVLQHIPLNITRFSAGFPDMVEAMSSCDNRIACHGDSGSPLVIHQAYNDTTDAVYVIGVLARIFGVYDHDPLHPTCPTPILHNSSTPSVIESFCNVSNMIPWIASTAGISAEELTDPFLMAPTPCYDEMQCSGRWRATHADVHQESNIRNIAFGDRKLQSDHPAKWWIGPILQDDIYAYNNSVARSLFHNYDISVLVISALILHLSILFY
ncbi:trypsin-like cysteine/serine peptidase domain-containing protein [Dichotomocladium elegans]|nr:trypsin-like cysteine/serine peptidase domain-containing protein [Dichotomocladium elegans]